MLNLLSIFRIGWPNSPLLQIVITHNAGDLGSIPGLGRSLGEGNGNPHQYSCLENPMDRGAWRVTVHGVARVKHNLTTKPPIVICNGNYFFFFFVVTMNSWILFIQCFAIIIVISVFNDQIVLIMAWGSPLNWLLVLLMCSHYSLSTFLLSGITKCSRLTLYFPCAKPGISHSSKEPWLLSVRRDIQKLEARHQVYSLLLWLPEAFLKDKII